MERALVGTDPGRESLANAKMGRFPCHLFIETDQTSRNTCNRDLASLCRRLHVYIDVAREVETAVDWRSYPRFQIDDRQASIFLNLFGKVPCGA